MEKKNPVALVTELGRELALAIARRFSRGGIFSRDARAKS